MKLSQRKSSNSKKAAPKKAAPKKRAPAKPKVPKTLKVAKSVPAKKGKFDTEAFTFNTPIEHIEAAMDRLNKQDEDPMAEPFTKDEIYWMVVWTEMLPEAKRRKMTHVPCCAKERAVLKLPKL